MYLINCDNILQIYSHSLERHDCQLDRILWKLVRDVIRVGVLELWHPVHHSLVLSERVRVLPKDLDDLVANIVIRDDT